MICPHDQAELTLMYEEVDIGVGLQKFLVGGECPKCGCVYAVCPSCGNMYINGCAEWCVALDKETS